MGFQEAGARPGVPPRQSPKCEISYRRLNRKWTSLEGQSVSDSSLEKYGVFVLAQFSGGFLRPPVSRFCKGIVCFLHWEWEKSTNLVSSTSPYYVERFVKVSRVFPTRHGKINEPSFLYFSCFAHLKRENAYEIAIY